MYHMSMVVLLYASKYIFNIVKDYLISTYMWQHNLLKRYPNVSMFEWMGAQKPNNNKENGLHFS